jgi:drug/metabolite transporter (DMT)-like permease
MKALDGTHAISSPTKTESLPLSQHETVFGLIIGAALMRAWPTAREGLGAALVVAGASLTIFGRQSSSATTGA